MTPPAEVCSFVSKVLMVDEELKAETRKARSVGEVKFPDSFAPSWLEGVRVRWLRQAALRRGTRAAAGLRPRRSRSPAPASSSAAGMQRTQTHLPSELRMCSVSDAVRQASHLKVLLLIFDS